MFLFAIAAALTLGAKPGIIATRSGHQLVLTRAMLAALDRWNPSFTPWQDRDYQPLIIRFYKFSALNAPFATFGDFNGDGRADVVIDGKTATHTVSVALLSRGDAYVVHVLTQSALLDPNHGLWSFLTGRIRAGTEIRVIDGPSFKTDRDAFEREWWEKSTAAYVWEDGKFKEFLTGD
jgi:hypothetical protein